MSTLESEKLWPDGERLALVQRCAENIEPDRLDLQDWLQSYARHHCHGIALDLEIVDPHSAKKHVIVECGCVPWIPNASWKDLGYNVHGIDIDSSRFYSAISRIGLNMSKCNIETEPLPLDTMTCDVVIFK